MTGRAGERPTGTSGPVGAGIRPGTVETTPAGRRGVPRTVVIAVVVAVPEPDEELAVTTDSPPRIVVGVDGSPASLQALRWAVQAARGWHTALLVVNAWRPTAVDAWAGYGDYPAPFDPRAEAEKTATAAVDTVCGPSRHPGTVVDAMEGPAARVLVDVSRDAVALVVGSRGRGGFTGLLLGSVSAHCAEHATCPVVVVHGDRLPPLPPPPTA